MRVSSLWEDAMNARMRSAAAALCLCIAPLTVSAEGRDSSADLASPAAEFPNAAGAYGSSMLGGGLSWQHWFGSLGIAVTAGGMAYPYGTYYGLWEYPVSGTGTADFAVWNYNVQLDLMYRLYSSNFWNWLSGDLYVFATLAHMGSVDAVFVDEDGDFATTDDEYYVAGDYIPAFAIDVGIGYEIVLFRHFSLPLQFGYTVKYPLYVDFTFSGGLRYRF
jgi:hypothetical protein